VDADERYGPVTARYYDAAYASLRSLGPDAEFYRALAAETGGPVLELGCGTGRVLARLAADGHACTGLDASREMLAVLERRAPAVRTVHGDMCDFALGECFRLVFSAFRAFQHLVRVEDQLRCLAAVLDHLEPGGTFAFDVFAPRLDRLAQREEPETEDLRFEQDGHDVVRYTRVVRSPETQTQRVAFRYERRAGGRAVADEHAAFSMRWFFRYELEHLLVRAGFTDVEIFGDFDRRPVGRDTPAFVVVARRPAASP